MGDLCTLLSWDSEHWGFPVARINDKRLTEDVAREAIRWCQERKVKCLYFAADGTCAKTLQLTWTNGFRFVDMRADMEKSLCKSIPNQADLIRCREAVEDDLPTMEQLARTAHQDTRFFKDTNFDRTKAADLYSLWIARDFREYKVFAAVSTDNPNKALGYISVSAAGGEVGRIGLVAVSPEARGCGLGHLLVEHASEWCRSRGADTVKVATQGTNIPALRLYEKCGFKVADVKVWFHLWLND